MQTADIRTELEKMIAAVESKIDYLHSLLANLKSTAQAIDSIPADILDLMMQPLQEQTARVFSTPNQRIDEQMKLNESIIVTVSRTQYGRLLGFFLMNQNRPATIAELSTAINAKKNALANVLYRTHKEYFMSHDVPGSRRLKKWSLRPEVYERERARKDQ